MRGIALEGGGSKGSFHVGALKALAELGVDYQMITGTSIGAINAAILISEGLESLEAIWRSVEMEDMIRGDTEILRKVMNFEFKNDTQQLKQFIVDTLKQGGLDITPFKVWLREVVDEERVRHSEVNFGLVTVSLTDLKPLEVFIKDIPKGMLHDYIFASANVPAFKDEKLNNKKMLDGAFYDNVPINMLFDRGCDEVIAIRVMGLGRIKKVKKEHLEKVKYIRPSEDLGKLLEVGPERSIHNITLGYYDTMRVFKGLYGSKYYLSDIVDEADVMKVLSGFPDDALKEIKLLLGSEYPAKRMLFEELIPLICDALKIEQAHDYSEITLRFYEFLAEEAGINRFEILDFNTFFNRVNAHYLSQLSNYQGPEDRIVRKLISTFPKKGVMLLSQKKKKELLVYVYYELLAAMSRAGFSS